MEINLDNIKKEYLGLNRYIYTTADYRFNTDSILLSRFAYLMTAKSPFDSNINKTVKNACDLGSGGGIIPILWSRYPNMQNIYAVEIQKQACNLFNKSVELNGEKRIMIINSDLNELKGKLPLGSMNLVSCNPPYKAEGSGVQNPDTSLKVARHEKLCSLEDIIKVGSSLLQFGGKFCLCQRPERLTDMIELMRKYNVEPKFLQLVCQNQNSAPNLFLICGSKGGKNGLTILPNYSIDSGEHLIEIRNP